MDEVERLETKKQERSKAKMAVTRAARRLMGATYRNVDFEALKGLSVELENVYDDFCVTSEEYELLVTDEKFAEHRVVNGDDLKPTMRTLNKLMKKQEMFTFNYNISSAKSAM